MSQRNRILLTINIADYEYLVRYLLQQIGERFKKEFKIVYTDPNGNFLNVEVELEDGIACYLLGRSIESYPISKYTSDLKRGYPLIPFEGHLHQDPKATYISKG